MQAPYVRVAEIEVDPARHVAYEAALKEEIEASVRLEPGVLALHAVCGKEIPRMHRVRDLCRRSRLSSPSRNAALWELQGAVEGMVTSLKLTETIPIALAAKPV